MSSTYLKSPDDFNVNDFITVLAPEYCQLHGAVLEIKHIELPFIIVKMCVSCAGELVKDVIFPLNVKGLSFKALSDEYVRIMARLPPKISTSEELTVVTQQPVQDIVVPPSQDFLELIVERAGKRLQKNDVRKKPDNKKRKN